MKMRRLIDAVKMRPVLYDPGHEDYTRHKEKDIKWEEVAEESNLPSGADAKSSWMKLRQSLRDALRRQQKCIRNGAETFKLWKYQQQMEFLLPFMSSQLLEGCSNLDLDGDISDEASSHNNYFIDYHHQEDSQMMDSSKQQLVQLTEAATGSSSSSANKRTMSKDIGSSNNNNNKRIRTSATSSSLHQSDDGLYYFFLSMYETTRKMPQASQLVVKNNIFRVVTSVEASLLNLSTEAADHQAGHHQWPTNDVPSSDNDGHLE